jgi:hypothetical protein
MNNDELRERLRARLNAPPDPPLEATRKFLQSYCSDADSLDEIRSHVANMLAINPRTILEGLAGIEGVLANPTGQAESLLYLVENDGNWRIEGHSEEGARAWLQEMAQLLREELQKKNLLPE